MRRLRTRKRQVADHAGDGAGPVPSLVGPDHLNRRDDLQRIADGRFRVWAIRDKNDWPLGRRLRSVGLE